MRAGSEVMGDREWAQATRMRADGEVMEEMGVTPGYGGRV